MMHSLSKYSAILGQRWMASWARMTSLSKSLTLTGWIGAKFAAINEFIIQRFFDASVLLAFKKEIISDSTVIHVEAQNYEFESDGVHS
jgi:hypothetical protein